VKLFVSLTHTHTHAHAHTHTRTRTHTQTKTHAQQCCKNGQITTTSPITTHVVRTYKRFTIQSGKTRDFAKLIFFPPLTFHKDYEKILKNCTTDISTIMIQQKAERQAVRSLLHTHWTPVTHPFQKQTESFVEHERTIDIRTRSNLQKKLPYQLST